MIFATLPVPGTRSSANLSEMNKSKPTKRRPRSDDESHHAKPRDLRRPLVLALSVSLLVVGGAIYVTADGDAAAFGANGMLRIGLVFGGLWLAWDSLRKPARWLPPGLAVLGVIGMAMVAAQPKMLIAVLPAFTVLLTVGSIVRAIRGKDSGNR